MEIYHFIKGDDVYFVIEISVSYKSIVQPALLLIRLHKDRSTKAYVEIKLALGGIKTAASKSINIREERCLIKDVDVVLKGWFLHTKDYLTVVKLVKHGLDMKDDDAMEIFPLATSLRSAVSHNIN